MHGFQEWLRISRDASVTYGVYALGGALLACVILARLRSRAAACLALGWTALLLYVSQQHENPIAGSYWMDLGAVTVGSLALAVVLTGLFALPGGRGLRAALRRTILPSNWSPTPMTLGTRERVTRWFVAVTAAVTGATFFQMAEPSFWEAAGKALAPHRIIYTLIIVIVPLVLVGPVEEYVLGYGAGEIEHEPRAHEVAIEKLWKDFSWRAAGRLAVVLAIVFQLTIFHSSFEETLGRGKLAAADLFTAGLIPGVIAYFWASAIQTGEARIVRRAAWGAGMVTLLFFAPGFWLNFALGNLVAASSGATRITVFLDPDPALGRVALGPGEIAAAIGVALPFAILLAVGLGLVAALQAGLGGAALNKGKKAWPIALMFLALCLTLLVPRTLLEWLIPNPEVGKGVRMLQAVLTAIGATAGLALSGFPQILIHARKAEPSTEANPS